MIACIAGSEILDLKTYGVHAGEGNQPSRAVSTSMSVSNS